MPCHEINISPRIIYYFTFTLFVHSRHPELHYYTIMSNEESISWRFIEFYLRAILVSPQSARVKR